MVHKALSSMQEVPYCFFYVICRIQGYMGKKLMILIQF